MKLYLSGPMTGYPGLNLPHFSEIAAKLRAQGHDVIDPSEVMLPPKASWADYMRVHIPCVIGCEGIAMLAGWEASRGARLEHHIASELGLPAFCAYSMQPLTLAGMEKRVTKLESAAAK